MNLGIFGGSGGVGREIVRQALERGDRVTAVVRELAAPTVRALSADEGALRIVIGSMPDPELARACVRGQDAILSALGVKRKSASWPWSPLASPHDFASTSVSTIAQAMIGEGVARLVLVSAAGVGSSAARMNPLMHWLLKSSNIGVAYRDLERAESMLEATALDWTALRPTRLTNSNRPERAEETDEFATLDTITRATVARTMLELVHGERSFASRTPQLTGR